MSRLVTLSLSAAMVFGSSLARAASEPAVATNVNLEKYMGRWYEIASIPQRFQAECAGNVVADYSTEANGEVKVVNSCRTAAGDGKSAEGRARPRNAEAPAKLEVTFTRVAGYWVFMTSADYWILDLAPDYSYAVVGNPQRTAAWILARKPSLAPSTLERIETRLRANGFDTCKIMTTVQEGGTSERGSLCRDTQPETLLPQALDEDERFTTFVAGLKQTGLYERLAEHGPYTVFAPTNDAYASLPEHIQENLAADPAAYRKILLHHIVKGVVRADDLNGSRQVMALNGKKLKLEDHEGDLSAEGAGVTVKDLEAKNGIVQGIGRVLMP